MVYRGNFEIPTRRLRACRSASELPVHARRRTSLDILLPIWQQLSVCCFQCDELVTVSGDLGSHDVPAQLVQLRAVS
jgi:hypothetical protein